MLTIIYFLRLGTFLFLILLCSKNAYENYSFSSMALGFRSATLFE